MAYSSLGQSDINSRFWNACKEGDLITFNNLLSDASVNTPVKGTTPIIAAIQFNQHSLLKKLLSDSRFSINQYQTSSGGHTVLHWAVMCGNISAIRTIGNISGVDLNIKNVQRETPIMLAITCKNARAVETLLEFDAVDLSTSTNNGISLENLAKQYMNVTSRKDSAFRGEMSRTILALLSSARQNRRNRENRNNSVSEMYERVNNRLGENQRGLSEMADRLSWAQEQAENLSRRIEELGILRQADIIVNNDDSDNDNWTDINDDDSDTDVIGAIFEVGAEEASRLFMERIMDRMSRIITDDSDSDSDTEIGNVPNNLMSPKIYLDDATFKKEIHSKKSESITLNTEASDKLKDSVDSISKTVEEKTAEIVAKIENLSLQITSKEKGAASYKSNHEKEKQELKEKQEKELNDHLNCCEREIKKLSTRQEKDIGTIRKIKCERELHHRLHESFHKFESEESTLRKSQETKMKAITERHENQRKELRKTQKAEVSRCLEEDKELEKLRDQKKELNRHLSKLSAKPEVLPCPECPVCYESMKPPVRILQCVNGHLVCTDCAKRMERHICPTCKQKFAGRATAMEQFLRQLFNSE